MPSEPFPTRQDVPLILTVPPESQWTATCAHCGATIHLLPGTSCTAWLIPDGASTIVELLCAICAGQPAVRTCRVCGCTDLWGCNDGCWWAEADLCSNCQPTQEPTP